MSVDVVTVGSPGTNVALADSVAPAKWAVTAWTPACVAVNGVDARPLASVTPFGLTTTSLAWLLANVTAWPGTALAYASRATRAAIAAADPLATTLGGVTAKLDTVAFAAPARAVTDVVTVRPPTEAPIVFAWARVVVSEVTSVPLPSVVPVGGPNESLPPLLLKVTARPGAGLP